MYLLCIAFLEFIIAPIIAYLIYKKQLGKYGEELVRKNGKKCLSPDAFLLLSLVILGANLALIMYQIMYGLAYM